MMEIKAIDILERCRKAPEDIERLEAQLSRLKERAEGLRGQDLGRIGSAGTGEADKLAAFAADIDDVERQIRRRTLEKIEEERVACRLIAFVPAIMGEILYRYYVVGMKLEAVAKQCDYHPAYVRKVKARGDLAMGAVKSSVVMGLLPKWYTEEAA